VTIEVSYLPTMPKNKHVAIGCIGSGFIMADCHLVAYRKAGFNPVAIASRKPANAKAVAERHSIAKVYATYQELLADPEIEVIDVAVPPDVQLEVMREIVEHNDHIRGVLAQKPMGMNYSVFTSWSMKMDSAPRRGTMCGQDLRWKEPRKTSTFAGESKGETD
jgi:predicted dehydrogenase